MTAAHTSTRRTARSSRPTAHFVLVAFAWWVVSGSAAPVARARSPLGHGLARFARFDPAPTPSPESPAPVLPRLAVRISAADSLDPAIVARVRALGPDVLVVLGARVRAGRPGRHLLQRVGTAFALYEALDRRPELLLTGGHGEAVAMRALLLARGVPDDRMVLEPRARTTMQNASYSMTLLTHRGRRGQTALLVTTAVLRRGRVRDDHAARALANFTRVDRGVRLAALSVNAEPWVAPRLYIAGIARHRSKLRASR